MDDLPGIGPARKRALLKHFGSPEAVLAAPARRARGGARRAAEGGARAVRPPQSDRSIGDDQRMSGNGAAPPGSNLVDLVIISGQSGAGKSSAMNVFEDAGYFCVDNLPAEMIRALAGLFMHDGSKVERAAVVSDQRGGEYFGGARAGDRDAALRRASRTACSTSAPTTRRCSTATRRRAGATRWRRSGNLIDGIRREAEALAPIRELADSVVDTSGLERRDAAAQDRQRAARGGVAAAARGHLHLLRPQARPAARRRPRVRRPLPAQPALRAGAARR